MNWRTAPFLSLIILVSACAKAPVKPNPSLCRMAESNVRQRLGPEFRRVIDSKLLHSETKGTYGCGIVYQMMDEEFSEEFESGASELQVESHMVAFLSRQPGQAARFLDVKRTRTAKGPVTVRLETVEVTGDEYLDLAIIERGKRPDTYVDYQGLKIINGDPNLTSEILELSLLRKTANDSEIISEWMVDNSQIKPTLWIRGGGKATRYTYSKKTRRLMIQHNMNQQQPAERTDQTPRSGSSTPDPATKATSKPAVFSVDHLEPAVE